MGVTAEQYNHLVIVGLFVKHTFVKRTRCFKTFHFWSLLNNVNGNCSFVFI